MSLSFFALISRMKYINRWGLMRNSFTENIGEHSHMVAVLAHALAVIRRDVYGTPCDVERAAALALYHDASEIMTGDLPTPIKYANSSITSAYKDIEREAAVKLIACLPDAMRGEYEGLLSPDKDDGLHELIKAADKLSALIKCIEERKTGNLEFSSAERQTRELLTKMELPEVSYFIENFLPAFELTLDEING